LIILYNDLFTDSFGIYFVSNLKIIYASFHGKKGKLLNYHD
jgi:hypothetical protein